MSSLLNRLGRRSPASVLTALILITGFSASQSSADWSRFSFDEYNSNYNSAETAISPITVKHLNRAWQTFNDDALSSRIRPSGFVLEEPFELFFDAGVAGVVASPLTRDGTIYYVDILGTVFARDARTGGITDPNRHWTTTLSGPDYPADLSMSALPEMNFTAPVLTDSHIWVAGAVNGQLHAVALESGEEVDFDSAADGVNPWPLVTDEPFASVLGDSVVVEDGDRQLYIAGINVIVNDALVQGGQVGVQIAIDITDPTSPFEAWRTHSIDINPATGARYGSGVSVGSGIAVDAERGLIYAGTGQNTSEPYAGYPDPALAPAGYIDRGDSLYAIDYVTGAFVWNNQFHAGDVFDLNSPTSTGPGTETDADVLSPPVLWSAEVDGELRDLVGVGSKGGLYRVADRDTGETVWEREVSKQTGIGGVQAGSAHANGVVYVAAFEGIDDGFSDAQFGTSFETGLFPNAFFATFSMDFWSDVAEVADDGDESTGMQIKVYALDAATGDSLWLGDDGKDYALVKTGAALRHVSVAGGVVFVSSSGGTLSALDAQTGELLYEDRTEDVRDLLSLGAGKPHHLALNTGVLVSDGMVFTGYGGQNNPSGGIIAWEIDTVPASLELLGAVREVIGALPIRDARKERLIGRVELIELWVNRGRYDKAIRQALRLSDGLQFGGAGRDLPAEPVTEMAGHLNTLVAVISDD